MLLLTFLLGEGCKSNADTPTAPEVADGSEAVDTLPSEFATFFTQFHDDSAYQMAHISFPLEGLPPRTGEGDTLGSERFFWQRENWKKHNRFTDPGGNFDHWFEVLDERIIEHWIHMKGTDMYMKRRFAKLDDGWYLIYYRGLRPASDSD